MVQNIVMHISFAVMLIYRETSLCFHVVYQHRYQHHHCHEHNQVLGTKTCVFKAQGVLGFPSLSRSPHSLSSLNLLAFAEDSCQFFAVSFPGSYDAILHPLIQFSLS